MNVDSDCQGLGVKGRWVVTRLGHNKGFWRGANLIDLGADYLGVSIL